MKVDQLALKTVSKGFECWKFSTSDENITRDFVSGSSVNVLQLFYTEFLCKINEDLAGSVPNIAKAQFLTLHKLS
jgi:hypothetical protein